MQPIYVVCGVSGSGKSWVCTQLKEKFHYIPHDEHYENHAIVASMASKVASRPVITECPFAERVLREELEDRGHKVIPIFVIEDPYVVKRRYQSREGKPLPKAAFTRASTITKRAEEWKAPSGTSTQILKYLQELKF